MGAPSTAQGSSPEAEDGLRKPRDSNGNDAGMENTGGAQAYLSLIQQYLSVFMLDNATFLAERCVAEFPDCCQAVYLQALCQYRAGNFKASRHILEMHRLPTPPPAPQQENNNINENLSPMAVIDLSTRCNMQYLKAQCSYELKEYSIAEDALLREPRAAYRIAQQGRDLMLSMDDWILQTSVSLKLMKRAVLSSSTRSALTSFVFEIITHQPCPVPNGAAGLALLGKIYRKSNRKERAINFFKMSLKLDPFLWTSFEALAELGEPIDPASAFGVTPIGISQKQNLSSLAMNTKTPLKPMKTPAASGATAAHTAPRAPASSVRGNPTAFETPGLTPIPVQNNSFMPVAETPRPVVAEATPAQHGNMSVVRRARQVAFRQYYPPSPETPMTNVTRSMRYLNGLSGDFSSVHLSKTDARSLFLTSENKASNVQEPTPANFTSNVNSTHEQQPMGGQLQARANSNDPVKPEKQIPDEKVQPILEVLSVAGLAYQQLCKYKCREALATFQNLSRSQQTTAWVLHQQGRAFLELNEFSSAQRCLEHMHQLEPGRMKGLELLSTVYWQTKKEVELASLAQKVVEWDRMAPEAWCVVGNCFSLQKDHEAALTFFQRSQQIDPDFTYTHTLSGYEYMANEDFDKALACFRQALRTNDRHYNAWYGLGGIYHRQEKFDLAEYHFERACQIHPSSSILRCNLGIAQYANGKAYQALGTLSEASRLDPRNPQARFQRATIYLALHRLEEALAELQKVLDAAPREATVHFAMGKVLKKLGRSEEAMKCFLAAMDLDPKDSQMIKSAMDKLDEPDIDEETMATF